MKKLLLVPALLFAACGDNLTPDEDQIAPTQSADDDGSAPAPDNDNPLFAFFLAGPSECADHSVNFEGHYGYPDGTQVDNPICRYDFGDGTSVDTCFAHHAFPNRSGFVTFTVADPATGQVATDQEVVEGPASFEGALTATSDGLSISWEAHGYYDGADVGTISVSIEPAANVIVEDPSVFTQGAGSVRVTEAGTYTVKLHTSIRFGEEGGCASEVEQTVDVVCNGDAH